MDDLDSLCRNSADGWDQTHSYIRTIQPRYRSGTNLKIRKQQKILILKTATIIPQLTETGTSSVAKVATTSPKA